MRYQTLEQQTMCIAFKMDLSKLRAAAAQVSWRHDQ